MAELTDWRIKQIKARVEYAVKPADDDTEPPRIEFDPYEDYREFLVAGDSLFVTDRPEDVLGKTILALEAHNHAGRFSLHRLRDEVGFSFSTDDGLTPLQGALKVRFTFTDQNTGAETVDTTYYPVDPGHDFPVTEANMPEDRECELLLKQDNQEPSVYRLVYVEPVGADVSPICKRLKCSTTKDPSRRRRCARLGCYRQ
jgi:hypothetical protein